MMLKGELKMDELKQAMEKQGVSELWQVDVRCHVMDSIFSCEDVVSARIASIRKQGEREKIENALRKDVDIYHGPNNVLVKTAIGKKWAKFFGYDYDASLLANEVYQKAMFPSGVIEPLNFGEHEHMIFSDGSYYRGDVMNSWSTTVNEFIRVHGDEYFDNWSGRYIPKGYGSWEAFLSDPQNYKKPLPDYVTSFMNAVYTIGNFIPVPQPNFNLRRNSLCKDYWDLTLLAVYLYYNDEKSNSCGWQKLFQEEGVQRWLGRKGKEGWSDFVRKNFMQDLVSQNADGTFGEPKELWFGHFTKGVLPEKPEDYQQFFTNASAWITARGVRIALALQNGVDIRTVSGMLGHADPGFTLRTYTHATNRAQERAAETVGQVFGQHL